MCRVVFNQKSGVGKSTIMVNRAAIAAARGERVLVVDLDRQGNTARYLLGAAEPPPDTGTAACFDPSLKFSVRENKPVAFIVESPFEGLHVMPGAAALDEPNGKLESRAKGSVPCRPRRGHGTRPDAEGPYRLAQPALGLMSSRCQASGSNARRTGGSAAG